MAEVKIERKRLKFFLEFTKEKNWKEGSLELLGSSSNMVFKIRCQT